MGSIRETGIPMSAVKEGTLLPQGKLRGGGVESWFISTSKNLVPFCPAMFELCDSGIGGGVAPLAYRFLEVSRKLQPNRNAWVPTSQDVVSRLLPAGAHDPLQVRGPNGRAVASRPTVNR